MRIEVARLMALSKVHVCYDVIAVAVNGFIMREKIAISRALLKTRKCGIRYLCGLSSRVWWCCQKLNLLFGLHSLSELWILVTSYFVFQLLFLRLLPNLFFLVFYHFLLDGKCFALPLWFFYFRLIKHMILFVLYFLVGWWTNIIELSRKYYMENT